MGQYRSDVEENEPDFSCPFCSDEGCDMCTGLYLPEEVPMDDDDEEEEFEDEVILDAEVEDVEGV